MDTAAAPATYQTPTWLRFILGRNPGWTIIRILLLVFASFVIFKFILLPIRVTGDSMFPTYKDGSIKFVNRLAYRKEKPRRGDVVAVEFAGDRVVLLKRIVAMPGETFQVIGGEIYINGERITEPYAYGKIPDRTDKPGTSVPVKLEPDQYVVFGDNRPISEGYLKYQFQIIGRVL